ncbi:hypothetical protein SUGI_0626960 [Cryptomeria japonica]|nr:hypothetical protein SUGI_0626960 [Cryptomeria japonica]
MAMEICMPYSPKKSLVPASFRTKSKSSTSPKLENSSYHQGLVHNTKEIDELVSTQSNGNPVNSKSSNRNKVGSGGRGGAEVEVVMKVTLLASGFVIGTRGASVREIGEAMGAVVQSWTETDCTHPAALPGPG